MYIQYFFTVQIHIIHSVRTKAFRTDKDLFFVLKNSSKDAIGYILLREKECEKINISPGNPEGLKMSLKKFIFGIKNKRIG